MNAEIADVARSVAVASYTSYRWLGRLVTVASPGPAYDAKSMYGGVLVQKIALRLYNDFYTVGRPREERSRIRGRGRRLGQTLAAANCGRGCSDAGWVVRERDAGSVVVQRNGLSLWVDPNDVRASRPIGSLEPGDMVAIRWSRDAPGISPGFYLALSDEGLALPRPQPLDRFYFNVGPDDAVDFMSHVTVYLNGLGRAFRLKIVDDPDGFDRCDTAVLALQRRDRPVAHREAHSIATAMGPCLRAGTPALTRRIGRGFAFAEDPGDGKSFGQHRCDLMASAIVAAFEEGANDEDGRYRAICERFAAAGIRPDAPFAHDGERTARDTTEGRARWE